MYYQRCITKGKLYPLHRVVLHASFDNHSLQRKDAVLDCLLVLSP